MSSNTNTPFANTLTASTLDTPLWVIVPAAGTGQRLGGDIAKQYQLLDGVSMLERTIDRLLELSQVWSLFWLKMISTGQCCRMMLMQE